MEGATVTDQAKMWGNLLKRLQSCAFRECRGHGLAIVSVKLMVRDGELQGWTRPVPTYTEPERGDWADQINLFEDGAVEALTGP